MPPTRRKARNSTRGRLARQRPQERFEAGRLPQLGCTLGLDWVGDSETVSRGADAEPEVGRRRPRASSDARPSPRPSTESRAVSRDAATRLNCIALPFGESGKRRQGPVSGGTAKRQSMTSYAPASCACSTNAATFIRRPTRLRSTPRGAAARHRLHRLRRDGFQPPRRQSRFRSCFCAGSSRQGHKPIVVMGGGHDEGRRPFGQGRRSKASERGGDRCEHRIDPPPASSAS